MHNKKSKALVTWLLSGCFLILLMVVVGGITRLTHSGLSIVKWDLVMGTLPPLGEQAWMQAFEQYKQFPEYQKLHYHFSLSDFKAIFFWEYLHRLIGRLIGLEFLVPFLYFWVKGRISRSLMPKLLLIFGLGALQGFLGWYMVKSGLVDRPFVSHYRLAIHLFTAFLTFGYILWVALGEYYGASNSPNPGKERKLYRFTAAFIGLLGLQLVYGAFVAGLKAGFVYNTFPLMGDRWIAEAVTAMEPFYLNFTEGLAGVQFIHRCLGLSLLILSVYMCYQARGKGMRQSSKAAIFLLFLFCMTQVMSGILTLVYAVPLALGVMHQAGALLLLAISLLARHHLRPTKTLPPSPDHKEPVAVKPAETGMAIPATA